MNLEIFLSGAQIAVEFVAALIVLIVVHEIGHFVACRLFNVDVEEFGIGLPPRAATLFESRGTKFTLNWLPLGGFVRPKGENNPEVAGGLAAANPWVRLVVFFAGPLMNILTGILLFTAMYLAYGRPVPVNEKVIFYAVLKAPENAAPFPAQDAGLKVCDLVVAVNDEPITSIEQLQSIIRAHPGEEVQLAVQRGGKIQSVGITPRLDPANNWGIIGVNLGNSLSFEPVPAGESIQMGLEISQRYAQTLLALPVRLIQGTMGPGEGDIVGLPGMVNMYSEIRSNEQANCMPQAVSLLTFFASISLSLGIINLLPIPALDGGRIVFLLPEIVLRRRIPPERENAVNAISFLILILLLLFINFRDLVNIFFQPK